MKLIEIPEEAVTLGSALGLMCWCAEGGVWELTPKGKDWLDEWLTEQREKRAPALEDGPTRMELQNRLDDLLQGFEFWKERKCASMELTTLDEVLLRWVEHNEGAA